MYRILIVDDEPYIVDWIHNLVESVDGYELDIYRAYSAKEAVNLLNRARIDVMISDICLPGMSGIELLKLVKSNWRNCKVIMLTGHDNFTFAYESFKHEAFQYILKTEDDEKILEAINNALVKCEIELHEAKEMVNMRTKTQESQRLAKQKYFESIVAGRETNVNTEVIAKYDLKIDPNKPCYILAGQAQEMDTNIGLELRDSLIKDIENLSKGHLNGQFYCEVLIHNGNEIIWFLQNRWDQEDDVLSSIITGVMEQVQCIYKRRYSIELSIVYCDRLFTLLKATDILIILRKCIKNLGPISQGYIICFKYEELIQRNCLEHNGIHDILQKDSFFEEVGACLYAGKEEQYFTLLKRVEEVLIQESITDYQATELYFKLALQLLRFINVNRLDLELATTIGLHKLMHIDVENNNSWLVQMDYIETLSKKLFHCYKEKATHMDLIHIIQEYIKEHISEDVSLVRLGEITGYNPTYLSRLYKESTGQTLMGYINQVRLSKVKELMITNELSLNQIAIKAGFSSRQYFNRFTKKMVGIAPEEYRKSLNGY